MNRPTSCSYFASTCIFRFCSPWFLLIPAHPLTRLAFKQTSADLTEAEWDLTTPNCRCLCISQCYLLPTYDKHRILPLESFFFPPVIVSFLLLVVLLHVCHNGEER